MRGIHRSTVNSLHKGQWRGALMFSLIRVWINDWVNNREAGDLRRYRAHYDVTVMIASLAVGQRYAIASGAILGDKVRMGWGKLFQLIPTTKCLTTYCYIRPLTNTKTHTPRPMRIVMMIMMTSRYGYIYWPFVGVSTGWFPSQRAGYANFDVFFVATGCWTNSQVEGELRCLNAHVASL